MRIEELRNMVPVEVISLIKAAGSSTHKIADGLDDVSQTTVSQIINNKYTGSEETINKVWERISFTLQHKEDLNPMIYSNTETFIKLLNVAIKHKSFNDDETMKFIELKKVLTNYSTTNQ